MKCLSEDWCSVYLVGIYCIADLQIAIANLIGSPYLYCMKYILKLYTKQGAAELNFYSFYNKYAGKQQNYG